MQKQTPASSELSLEEDVANIIKGIAYFDISIENEKIKCAENPNFDANVAWNILDIKRQGVIDLDTLIQFLATNRIAVSDKETKYLMRLLSSSELTYENFVSFVLPRTNDQLARLSLQRHQQIGGSKQAQFHLERVIQRTSEALTAKLFEMEISAFREIEELRKNFSSQIGQNVQQIFRMVDQQEHGYIDYYVLCEFFKRLGVSFNENEYSALLYRTTEDGNELLDYSELIYMLLPIDPYTYPHYRQNFSANSNYDYVIRKAKEFKVDVRNQPFYYPENQTATPSRIRLTHPFQSPSEQKYYSYDEPIRRIFDPIANGKPTYNCDEGYMAQLKSYNDRYFQPSRENTVQYTNRYSEGMRYHDQHFDTFYKHLHDRNQNETLFNKYGKRYAFDTNLNSTHEQIVKQARIQRLPESLKKDAEEHRLQLQTLENLTSRRTLAAEKNINNTIKFENNQTQKPGRFDIDKTQPERSITQNQSQSILKNSTDRDDPTHRISNNGWQKQSVQAANLDLNATNKDKRVVAFNEFDFDD